MGDNGHYIRFEGIGKTFPGVRALDEISFGVRKGSVRALIGENGAGKSTLLKILSGVYRPTDGRVFIDGHPRRFTRAADALAAGIAVIYQELQLVGEMSVAENLYLGHLPGRFGVVDRKALRRRALEQLETMGEAIDPGTKVGQLPIAQRQMVEIAKALTRGAKVIAFDEPTSSLSDREVRKLFEIIRQLRDRGHAILYVSHRMDEIFDVCDSVTVFRDGKHVETFETMDGVTHDLLVNRMVGRDIEDIYGYEPHQPGEMALEVSNVTGPGLRQPASFSVARGEVLGVFGLVGAGRSELMRLVFGATRMGSGLIRVHGRPVKVRSPADAIRAGIMLCPEDRKRDAIIPVRSVLENLNLSTRAKHAYMGFVINESWEQSNAAEQVKRLDIKTPSLGQLAMNLSGGNQQKLIVARWLSGQIRVMLFDEPTRGVDVGAKSEIYSIIHDLARKGIGVVMVTSDLPEVLGVADRILVMRQGRIAASLDRGQADQEKILTLALPVG